MANNEKDAATAAVEAIALAIARAEAAHRAASENAFGRKVERLAGAIESALGEQPPPDPVAPTPQPAAKSRWWGGDWRPAAYSAALATLLAILLAFTFFSADDTPPVKQAAVAERSAPPPLAEKSANEAKIYPLAEESASDMAAIKNVGRVTRDEVSGFDVDETLRVLDHPKVFKDPCDVCNQPAALVFPTKRPEQQAKKAVEKSAPPKQQAKIERSEPVAVERREPVRRAAVVPGCWYALNESPEGMYLLKGGKNSRVRLYSWSADVSEWAKTPSGSVRQVCLPAGTTGAVTLCDVSHDGDSYLSAEVVARIMRNGVGVEDPSCLLGSTACAAIGL